MLVLTRKLNESIAIGDGQIQVTILDVRGGRVRLGIVAPPTVAIRRKELVEESEHAADDASVMEEVSLQA